MTLINNNMVIHLLTFFSHEWHLDSHSLTYTLPMESYIQYNTRIVMLIVKYSLSDYGVLLFLNQFG